jgi:hypothetical protein
MRSSIVGCGDRAQGDDQQLPRQPGPSPIVITGPVGVDGSTASRAKPGRHQPRPEPSMTQYKHIAIDTSKVVFTLHGIAHTDRPVPQIERRRGRMVEFFKKLAPDEIAAQARGGSHHWAREVGLAGCIQDRF